jgi:hypothetical protein
MTPDFILALFSLLVQICTCLSETSKFLSAQRYSDVVPEAFCSQHAAPALECACQPARLEDCSCHTSTPRLSSATCEFSSSAFACFDARSAMSDERAFVIFSISCSQSAISQPQDHSTYGTQRNSRNQFVISSVGHSHDYSTYYVPSSHQVATKDKVQFHQAATKHEDWIPQHR